MKIIKWILFISLIVFGISFFQKDKLPEKNEIVSQLLQEPVQKKTKQVPFEVEKNGVAYTITPLYDYELNGLIVSYNHSDSWWDYYHRKWGDFLNIKDVCVVWGENIKSGVYQKMKFTSGSWTCYFKSDTREEWGKFRDDNLSNNHLLADDEIIEKVILSAKKGDQIHLKGFLASYSKKDGTFTRGTSINRTDKGNHACETIFLTDFQILKSANQEWRLASALSKYLIIICLVLSIASIFRRPNIKKHF